MTLETLCEFFTRCLTDNQAIVFSYSFGLNKRGETKNLTELANDLGCSVSSVKEHLEAALEKLKLPIFEPIILGLKSSND